MACISMILIIKLLFIWLIIANTMRGFILYIYHHWPNNTCNEKLKQEEKSTASECEVMGKSISILFLLASILFLLASIHATWNDTFDTYTNICTRQSSFIYLHPVWHWQEIISRQAWRIGSFFFIKLGLSWSSSRVHHIVFYFHQAYCLSLVWNALIANR